MSTSSTPPNEATSSTSPFLQPRSSPPSSPTPLSILLNQATGRSSSQQSRAPSTLVRETAARELQERRADWGYSKPVVALDSIWNLAFVEGQQQQRPEREEEEDNEESTRIWSRSSVIRRFESANTMASFLWWMVGFYWVVSGGDVLLQHAPRLYWLAVVFLAFDVFFAIFCVVLACLIGIALCCCLPCIIAILYAVAGQEGASEADLSILPKYRFEVSNDGKSSMGAGKMVPLETNSEYVANGRTLLPEDAECCICLMSYDDGVELHTLPCNHHFHSMCIIKWLKMNATCPLCKYNILKGIEETFAAFFEDNCIF
ncbi:hypothetical protein ACFE04_030418 [Oxalis oulophora]